MDQKPVKISVRSLVEFILRSGDIDDRFGQGGPDREAMQAGSRLHRKIQGRMSGEYQAEVSLSGSFACGGFRICVEGRADGILADEDGILIDEIKGVMRELDHLDEPVPVHLAQAKCYAYLYGLTYGLTGGKCIDGIVPLRAAGLQTEGPEVTEPEAGAAAEGQEDAGREKEGSGKTGSGEAGISDIRVRMSYVNLETEEMKYFLYRYTFSELEEWFLGVLGEYRKWAAFSVNWREIRQASIRRTEFPFPYREGQRDLAAAVYRTISREKMLFIQAPTGTGKTLSTVFPAVKALGEEKGDKIFYLTARTIARTVASEAFDQLRVQGLRLKSIVLTAKEKICPMEEMLCNPEDCPYAKGHFDRINDAVYSAVISQDVFGRKELLKTAETFSVCPFELSLDLSLWVDAVICDYNYVFHPRARLKRFFGESSGGDYLFLIDEAHNLVERGREMYSASLEKDHFTEVRRAVKEIAPKLARSLGRVNRQMLALKRETAEEPGFDGGTGILPARGELWRVRRDPQLLVLPLMKLSGLMEDYLEEARRGRSGYAREAECVRNLWFEILTFLDVTDRAGEDYVFYTEVLSGGGFRATMFCVDPSVRLQECMDKARSTILFSATLLPVDYYKSMLSTRDDNYAVYARSSFPKERLQVFVGRDTTSRYTRRTKEEYGKIAAYIRQVTEQKTGNYLVFFSSYRMLEETAAVLCGNLPAGYEMLCQQSGMSEESRESFLEAFSGDREKGLIGMCVMGSIFGEGIDLKYDRLIGAVIVGTGFPQVCARQEILRQYYDSRGRDGFRYAYLCPGMNKVMQAAGRVIRTEEDRGVIVLLDERFMQNACRSMFPREWEGYRVCSVNSIRKEVKDFWESLFKPGILW